MHRERLDAVQCDAALRDRSVSGVVLDRRLRGAPRSSRTTPPATRRDRASTLTAIRPGPRHAARQRRPDSRPAASPAACEASRRPSTSRVGPWSSTLDHARRPRRPLLRCERRPRARTPRRRRAGPRRAAPRRRRPAGAHRDRTSRAVRTCAGGAGSADATVTRAAPTCAGARSVAVPSATPLGRRSASSRWRGSGTPWSGR